MLSDDDIYLEVDDIIQMLTDANCLSEIKEASERLIKLVDQIELDIEIEEC